MNKFGNFVTNEYLQLVLMIPVFLGALYVAMRITSAGMDIRCLLRSRPRLIMCIALAVPGALCLGYMFLSHLELQIKNAPINRILVWISGCYVAFFMYFLQLLIVTDLLRFLLRNSGHREVLARLFMAFSVGFAVFLTVYGVIHARNVRTVHYDLSSEGRLSAPLRVVEVSDLHMGSVIGTAHVQRVVDAVNASQPDLVVFLGDQFNRTSAVDVVDAEAIFKILSHIEAPLGVYAVLGNHDPDLNTEIYQQYLSESGITALDNGVLEIIPGSAGQQAEIRTLVSASSDGSESVVTPETPADGALLLAGRTKVPGNEERVPLAELLDQAGIGIRAGSGGSGGKGSGGSSDDGSNDGSGGGLPPFCLLLPPPVSLDRITISWCWTTTLTGSRRPRPVTRIWFLPATRTADSSSPLRWLRNSHMRRDISTDWLRPSMSSPVTSRPALSPPARAISRPRSASARTARSCALKSGNPSEDNTKCNA